MEKDKKINKSIVNSDPELSCKGPFNNYVDKMRGGGGQKMSFFVHALGIETVHVRVASIVAHHDELLTQ